MIKLPLLNFLRKSSNSHFVLAGFIFLALFMVYFKSILFSDSLIISDGLVPADIKVTNWSKFIFSGYPLLADPIWDGFYPIRIIIYKILGLDFNYFIISGYILMAIFTYSYVYFLTKFKISAFISAIIFSFSGYAIFEIGHAANFIHTICWLPLILLALEKLKNQISFFWILVCAITVPMTISGGFPQLSLAIFPILFSYALLLSFQTANKFKKSVFYISLLMASYLIAAPIIIPTVILSLASFRVHLDWSMFASFYVELKQLLLFHFPYIMGGYLGRYSLIPIFGNWDVVGNHGFVGFLTVILAAIALLKRPTYLKSVCYYWLSFCIISVLVALGPEIKFLYRTLFHIPVINNFRAPERYLFIFSFGMSVLAGIGIQVMQLGLINTKRQKIITFSLSVAFALILICGVIWLYPALNIDAFHKNHFQLPPLHKNVAFTTPLLWIVCSLMALLLWLRKPTSLLWCCIAGSVLVGELLYTDYFSPGWHPNTTFWTKKELSNPPAYLTDLRNDLNSTYQRYLKMQAGFSGLAKYLLGNFSIYFDLPSAGGQTPLAISRYLNFLGLHEGGGYLLPAESFENNQAVNIAGIKYLMSDITPLNNIWFKNKQHFQFHKKVMDTLIYKNTKALPRVWFTSKAVNLPDLDTIITIHTGKFLNGEAFDPAKTALIMKAQDLNFEEDKTAQAKIQTLENNKVVINTHTEKPQFMVLSDVYYPGWKAYIDNKKSDFYLTDYVYRGIVIPAGEHTVVFKFIPTYLYISYGISILSLLILIIFYIRYKRTNA